MITYFDTSALLKVLIEEEGSQHAAMMWDTADTIVSVSLVVVEGRAALAAARRGRRLSASQHRRAVDAFTSLADELALVEVTQTLVEEAAQLAEDDGLRGYDAVHLAAALAVDATVLCSSDADMCEAALRHGLHVANPLDP